MAPTPSRTADGRHTQPPTCSVLILVSLNYFQEGISSGKLGKARFISPRSSSSIVAIFDHHRVSSPSSSVISILLIMRQQVVIVALVVVLAMFVALTTAWPVRGRAMYECCCEASYGCDDSVGRGWNVAASARSCFVCYNNEYVCNCDECSCYSDSK
jgi:hypothetical protein